MVRAGFGLAAVLLVGCAQLLGLEEPEQAGDSGSGAGNSGSGAGTDGGNAGSGGCTGVVTSDGFCYERYDDAVPWASARDRCAMRGAILAKVETSAVEFTLGSLLAAGDEAYIGANDQAVNGLYRWVDDTVVTYTPWLPFQPDATNEHCIAIQNAGSVGWEDLPCAEATDYICQRRL